MFRISVGNVTLRLIPLSSSGNESTTRKENEKSRSGTFATASVREGKGRAEDSGHDSVVIDLREFTGTLEVTRSTEHVAQTEKVETFLFPGDLRGSRRGVEVEKWTDEPAAHWADLPRVPTSPKGKLEENSERDENLARTKFLEWKSNWIESQFREKEQTENDFVVDEGDDVEVVHPKFVRTMSSFSEGSASHRHLTPSLTVPDGLLPSSHKNDNHDDDVTSASTLPPASPLHAICAHPNATLSQLRTVLEAHPEAVSLTDADGNLPLHIISRNIPLLRRRPRRQRRKPLHHQQQPQHPLDDQTGGNDAEIFIRDLLDFHPDGILLQNYNGDIPFVALLRDWILALHRAEYDRLIEETNRSVAASPNNSSNLTARLKKFSSPFANLTKSQTRANDNPISQEDHFAKIFPRDVFLPPVIERAFVILSSALDHFSRPIHRNAITPTTAPMIVMMIMGGPSTPVSAGGFRATTRQHQMNSRRSIVRHIASIPHLLKTLLLIEEPDTRNRILNLSIIRRSMLCDEIMDKFFVYMLQIKGESSKRVVDFFVYFSTLSPADWVGPGRSVKSADIAEFRRHRRAAFQQIEQYANEILPSLVLLPHREVERASTTPLIWTLLSDSISRPFVIGIVMIDLVLHLTLMLSFRISVADYGQHIIHQDASQNPSFSSAAVSEDEDETLANVTNVLVYIIGVHYILRGVSTSISLMRISKNVLRSYVLDFWRVIDALAISFAMVGNGLLRTSFLKDHDNIDISPFLALAQFLLWLKLLGFLKAVNMHLATFILSVLQIISDIRWFLLVLSIAILMFGDMIHIVTTYHENGDLCRAHLPTVSNGDEGGENAEGGAQADFCDGNLINSYIRMYSVLVGDFEFDDYRSTPATILFFVLFTLVGVIVLLNVLIAIVSDSYEKSCIRSANLFGRARVGFAAEHISLESFLRPSTKNLLNDFSIFRRADVLWACARLARWIVLASLMGTAVIVDWYLLQSIIVSTSTVDTNEDDLVDDTNTTVGELDETQVSTVHKVEIDVFGIAAMGLCLILNLAIVVVFDLLFQGCACPLIWSELERWRSTTLGQRNEHDRRRRAVDAPRRWLHYLINGTIGLISERIFGISSSQKRDSLDGFMGRPFMTPNSVGISSMATTGLHPISGYRTTLGEADWGGRLDFIMRQTSRIVTESEQRMMAVMRQSEERLRDHSERLAQTDLRTEYLHTLNSSERNSVNVPSYPAVGTVSMSSTTQERQSSA